MRWQWKSCKRDIMKSFDDWLLRQETRLRRIPPERRALVILIVGIVLLGSLIAIDQLALRDVLDQAIGPTPDVPYYRARTQTVLDGGWLYRDIPCESPPLIVYFMLPAQLLGGQDWTYEVYFSAFTILTALSLYFGLRRYDDYRAFMVAILFLFLPFGTTESTFGIQDEAIVMFLFMVPLILAMHRRLRLSVVTIAVGLWTKIFNVFFYPVLFLNTRSWRERFLQVGIIALASLIIAAPFLAIAPNEFLAFPSYYFLGGGSGPTGGISIWDFLALGGFGLPGVALLAIVACVFVASLWIVYKKKLGIWEGMLVVLVALLIVYPRTALVYYTLPITLLLLWGSQYTGIAIRCFVMYVPFGACVFFSKSNQLGAPIIDVPWAWIAGLLLSIIGLIMLVETTLTALKKTPFTARNQISQKEEQSVNDNLPPKV
ncbi:MAG: hypothetical protein LUQ14_04335 [Methanomassiliicoccales archaeon]|nr:hypothetical protein [Methanomassiliicoccales archaeon]